MGAVSRTPIGLRPRHKGGRIAIERDLALGPSTVALLWLSPLMTVIGIAVRPPCKKHSSFKSMDGNVLKSSVWVLPRKLRHMGL